MGTDFSTCGRCSSGGICCLPLPSTLEALLVIVSAAAAPASPLLLPLLLPRPLGVAACSGGALADAWGSAGLSWARL